MAVGSRLVSAGHAVTAVRRNWEDPQEALSLGMVPAEADVVRPDTLTTFAGKFDWVINTVSSSRGGVDVYRDVYWQGTKNLLECLASELPQRYVVTSSTSVYGQQDGSVVTESSETIPGTETGHWLLETEALVLNASKLGFPGIILRVGGIYGPARGHLFQQYLKGEAVLEGNGDRWINMVHRDDVASAVEIALARGVNGQIYNVVDNESVSQRGFFEWLSATMGRPMPPSGAEAGSGRRKRARTHKRVSNEKLRTELGWVPTYPSFREGYEPLIVAAKARSVSGSLDSGES